jgi:hypothetical protein
VTALVQYINRKGDPRPPYEVHVGPISDASTFWEWVEQNESVGIVSVMFDLVTPNMFDGPENMDADMKALRDREKAKRVKFGLEGEDGLNLHTKPVEGLVSYTADGGGDTKAKARNKKTYNSANKIRRVQVPEPDTKDEKTRLQEILAAVKGLIFTIFKP